ncbi:MAG: ATP-binding cassette domain-containing protein [Deltaproteobacteria bacterium]|nr:ATP-binding cassette domain-containing protein [Deltaproteobacteria bacterium]MCZ6549080.1 ATP-binding cassette domain-containing protein [Deltaproteobacteria bacterium]
MIQIVKLHKSFAGHEVLKGVNLNIETGKITTIIGGSGCGKTVLLKHLNALLLPDHGQVIVDGVEISNLGQKNLNKIRHRFGVLFQGAALLDSMTIYDNVAFPLREKTGMDEGAIRKKVEERIYQVGLEGMGYKFPAEVSGGMKKRAGLARALIMDPEIVLFDEPTTGLDPLLGKSIHELIVKMHATFGFTGVIVSHDIPEVFTISDFVAMLWNGVIEEIGPTEEFLASHNPVVQQFIKGETQGPIRVL